MSNSIFEEDNREGASPAGGMGTAQQNIEKQARQLAYDTRYEVKKQMGDKPVNPAIMKRFLLQRLQKSTAAPNVKLRAKQMLLGEDYIGNVENFASNTVANALYKVFVEGVYNEEIIELNYLKELDENPERKYKIRVTDKKTGNSYVRYATREKITELRINPNIQSVEMTEYGEPREGERQRGDQTAAAKSGKDYDGDGKDESGAKEHAGAVHNAIQRKKGGVPDGKDTSSVREEFLTDATTKSSGDKKITGGADNYSGKRPAVTVMPTDGTEGNTKRKDVYAHYEPTGEVIAETGYSRFLNMIQEKKMTKAEKKKETKLKSKYDPSGMKASMENQYGSEKGKNFYFATIRKQAMGEESECGCDEKSNTDKDEMRDDPRSMKTKVNLVKNKFRSMGLNMSYEPEGNLVDGILSEELIENFNIIIEYLISEEFVNNEEDAVSMISSLSESALAKIASKALKGVIRFGGQRLSKTKIPPKTKSAFDMIRDRIKQQYGSASLVGTPEYKAATKSTKSVSRPKPVLKKENPYRTRQGESD